MQLEEVSEENIRNYYKTHYNNGTNNYNRNADIVRQLIKDYPSHTLIEHVLPKAILINQLYSTNIFSIDKMAEHITRLNISEGIKSGDDHVIEAISKGHGIKSKKKEKEFEFYSFATKYAWCHNPSKFIIYDGNVDCVLWEYKNLTNFSDYRPKDLKSYSTYKEIYQTFRSHFNIEHMDGDLIDKFFWRQGDLLLKEKRQKTKQNKRLKLESLNK